jgi:hypothetical protein
MVLKPKVATVTELQAEIEKLRSQLRAYSLFNERDYLQANPDVRMAVTGGLFPDGLSHFREVGIKERRFPGYGGFDWDAYVRANGDLAHFRKEKDPEASARKHFRDAGFTENRSLAPK